jgi:hypothetical protein
MRTEAPDSIADLLAARLPDSPDVYLQKIDLPGQVLLLVQLDPTAYRAASFLDDRILGPDTRGAWIALSRAAHALRTVSSARPLHFIFHTGHVGSTLVSRLLDETGTVLSLREPLPLRTLAEVHDVLGQVDSLVSGEDFDLLLSMFLRSWSRGYDATGSVVLKATSSTGRLATKILTRAESARAIYMNLRAEPYLATLLAGQNSPTDLRGHAPERVRRLRLRVAAPIAPLYSMSIGELAALAWLVETFAQRDALAHFHARVIAVDFDEFLADVAGAMQRIVGHFDLGVGAGYLAEVARSPVLTRYSKAPEYAYTSDVRARVLRDSQKNNREEIRKGLAWLERLAQADPAAAKIVGV